jgi:hypothetical protein
MGGGNRQSADAAKARPLQALVDIELGKDGGASAKTDSLVVEHCEVRRRLSFAANPRTSVPPGAVIRLRLGDVLYVVDQQGAQLGTISDPQAMGIRQCILDGYEMAGRVSAFDPGTGRGEVKVQGRRE